MNTKSFEQWRKDNACNNCVKPRSRAWVNGKTIWFTLYRRSKYPISARQAGQWIPITRTHPKTAWAAKLVKKIMADYAALALINGAETDGTDAVWLGISNPMPRDPKERLRAMFVKPQKDIEARLCWIGGFDLSEFASMQDYRDAIALAHRIVSGAETDGTDAQDNRPREVVA